MRFDVFFLADGNGSKEDRKQRRFNHAFTADTCIPHEGRVDSDPTLDPLLKQSIMVQCNLLFVSYN